METIIRALPRSRSITGLEFRYNLISGSHKQLKVLRIDKKIFEIYTSSGANEVEKVKNPFILRVSLIAALAVFGIFFAWKYIFNAWSGHDITEARASVSLPQNMTHIPSTSALVPVRPIAPAQTLIPHKLNYLALSAGRNSSVKIAFDGRVYTLHTFPYKVEMHEDGLYGLIPQDDYLKIYPNGKPERKYYNPKQDEEDRRQARLERAEPFPLAHE